MSQLEIKSISQLNEFRQLKAPWDELVPQMDHPLPYVTHDWLSCWWEAFGKDGDTRILTGWQNGKLVGGLPLMFGSQRLGRVFRFHGFQSASNTESPGFGILSSPKSLAPFLAACARHITSEKSDWDFLFWLRLQAGKESLQIIQSGLTSDDTSVLVNPYPGSYRLDLQPDFDVLFKGRGKAFVRDRTYKNNKLAKLGVVELKTSTAFDESMLAEFYRMEGSGWKKPTSILAHADKKMFYDQLARTFAGSNRFLLSLLHLNGQPIAGVFGLVCNETFYFLKIGVNYDIEEKLRKTSPGQALLFHLIRHCCDQKLKYFDFCGPFYEYERMWTDRIHQKYNILILNQRQPLVKLYWHAQSILRRLAPGRTKSNHPS